MSCLRLTALVPVKSAAPPLQIVHGQPRATEIAVPKQPFEPLDVGQQPIACGLIALRSALGILA